MTKEIIEAEIERIFPQFNQHEIVAATMAAEWMQEYQHKIDINKACKRFEVELKQFQCMLNYLNNGAGDMVDIVGSLVSFRKAMEG